MPFTTEDNRKHRQLIARRKLTLTATAATFGSVSIPICGKLLNYIIISPNLTTDVSFDFAIKNDDDRVIYEDTGIADNSSETVLTSAAPIPLSGLMKFECSFTTSQTATFEVYLYYE